MNIARPLSIVAGVSLAAALLSGCSAINNVVKAQTHTAACFEIAASLKSVGESIQTEAPKLASEPQSAAAAISKDTNRFSTAASKVSNPAVKKKAEAAAKQLTKFSADITAFANNPGTASEGKIQTDLTPLSTSMQGIETECKG